MATVRVSKDIVAPVVPVFREFMDAHIGADGLDPCDVPAPLVNATTGLTAFERNRMYTITRYAAGIRIDTTFRFEPVRGATRVTAEIACAPRDDDAGSFESLVGASEDRMAQTLAHDLTDLKRFIETPQRPVHKRAG